MLIIPYAIASAITVFGNTVFLKSLGMFLQGSFHVKVALSYTHMYELGPDSIRPMIALILNLSDALILPITGIFIKFCSKDLNSYYQYICLF